MIEQYLQQLWLKHCYLRNINLNEFYFYCFGTERTKISHVIDSVDSILYTLNVGLYRHIHLRNGTENSWQYKLRLMEEKIQLTDCEDMPAFCCQLIVFLPPPPPTPITLPTTPPQEWADLWLFSIRLMLTAVQTQMTDRVVNKLELLC